MTSRFENIDGKSLVIEPELLISMVTEIVSAGAVMYVLTLTCLDIIQEH